MKQFNTIVTISLIFLYAYTALSKLLRLQRNETVLSHLPFVGKYAAVLAWSIPVAELLIVAMLLSARWHTAGLYCSMVLFSVFTVYLACMLLFKQKLPCTCGGVLEKFTWTQHVFFNLFFIILNIVAIKFSRYSVNASP